MSRLSAGCAAVLSEGGTTVHFRCNVAGVKLGGSWLVRGSYI